MTTSELLLGILLIISVICILAMSRNYYIKDKEYEKQKKELLKEVKQTNEEYEKLKAEALSFKLKWLKADSLLKDPKQYEEIEKEYIQTLDSIDNADWDELLDLWSR